MKGLVLIVDDEPALRESLSRVLKFALRTEGLAIESVPSGEAALPMVESAPPLLAVVSDYNLGNGSMDGLQLLAHVRAARPDARLVLMSGFAIESLARANLTAIDRYLPKPFDVRELIETLQNVFRGVGSP